MILSYFVSTYIFFHGTSSIKQGAGALGETAWVGSCNFQPVCTFPTSLLLLPHLIVGIITRFIMSLQLPDIITYAKGQRTITVV